MSREIEEYLIPPVSPAQVPAFLEQHFAAKPRLEFRIKDLTPVASFAVGYFFDAMQKILDKAMLGGEEIDVALGSGWRARTVDIGHLWKRHIEFISPSDPNRGFVLQGQLDMVETESPEDAVLPSDDYIAKLMSNFKTQEDLVESNASSPEYLPENSVRIDEYSVFPFAVSDRWYETAKADVFKSLLKSKFVSEAFEYRPQTRREDKTLEVERGARSITEPGAAIEALRVISELAFSLDPDLSSKAMREHSSVVYNTLVEEHVALLSAVRGTLNSNGYFPSSPFPEMVAEIWRLAACEDVLRNLHFVTESADALIDLGHTSPEEVFDCNDGRTRAYATTDGDSVSVYCEWEEWSTLVKVRGDRVEVRKCDFETGEVGLTIVDLEHSDGVVVQINEICPYDDLTAGVMTRSLVDLSSVHCHVVSDRKANNNSSSPRP